VRGSPPPWSGRTAPARPRCSSNLDLPSAEALQQGLEFYQGTVLAVTHDRWFARSFERFLIFTPDGNVREATEPAWD